MPKLSALAAISWLSCAGCAAQPQTWPVRVLPQEAPAVAAPTPDPTAREDDADVLPLPAVASEPSDARIGPPGGSGAGSRRVMAAR